MSLKFNGSVNMKPSDFCWRESGVWVWKLQEVEQKTSSPESAGDASTSSIDTQEKLIQSRNALNEIAALQMIRSVDPDGTGNVINAEMVASDDIQVYIVMPLCKEGSLMDLIGSTGNNGRLNEDIARRYFSQILNVSYCFHN